MLYTYNGIWVIHKKEWCSDTCHNIDETYKHYTIWNKPYIKGQILYDFAYMKYLEQANSERQKVEWQLPGAEGSGEWGVIA